MPAEVETMVSGRRMVPWHQEGTVVDGLMTAAEALDKSGLDWEVDLRPVYIDGGAGDTPYTPVPGKFATVRTTDDKALGIVGSKYTVLQNKDAFAFADLIVDDGSAKYDTAGSLRGGKTVWLSMIMPEGVKVGGVDPVDVYLMLRNSHDGSSMASVMVTPVRTVCQNTLNLAIGSAQRVWSVRHVGDIQSHVLEARESLDLTFSYLEEFQHEADALLQQGVSDRKFDEIAEQLSDVDSHMEGMINRFRNSPNLADYRNTGWAAVNAVGEHWEHDRSHQTEDARVRSTLQGKAMRMRDSAYALVKAAA